MRVKDVVRASKTDVSVDDWQTGPMAKTLFPLGKSGKHALNLRAFDWCVIRFAALGCRFRIVLAVHLGKQVYYAHLGKVHGNDTQMLASYEYHSTHGGWHVHAGCGDTTYIPVGRYKGPWKRRIPRDHKMDRRQEWGLADKDAALSLALRLFGIDSPAPAGQQMALL